MLMEMVMVNIVMMMMMMMMKTHVGIVHNTLTCFSLPLLTPQMRLTNLTQFPDYV